MIWPSYPIPHYFSCSSSSSKEWNLSPQKAALRYSAHALFFLLPRCKERREKLAREEAIRKKGLAAERRPAASRGENFLSLLGGRKEVAERRAGAENEKDCSPCLLPFRFKNGAFCKRAGWPGSLFPRRLSPLRFPLFPLPRLTAAVLRSLARYLGDAAAATPPTRSSLNSQLSTLNC